MGFGKKDKKKKKSDAPVQTVQNVGQTEENKDVKDVLQLFNKLEEMVIDGDPRIKEALKQKPGIQNLLRDDSSLFGLTPRSYIGQLRSDQVPALSKEGTYTSFQPHQLNQFSPRTQHIPLQTNQLMRSPRKTRPIIVPPIAIPEHSTLGDTFSNGYHAALVKQHPDGTLESMRMEQPERSNPVPNPSQLQKQAPVVPQLPIENVRKLYIPERTQSNQPQPQQIHAISDENSSSSRYHSFVYDSDGKQTTVRIHIPEDKLRPTINPQEKEISKYTSGFNSQAMTGSGENSFSQPEVLMDPIVTKELVYSTTEPIPTTTYNKEQKTTVHSTVIDENGGTLSCFGCKIQVPKNGVKKKCLLRISILGISETPHKTDRIFNRSLQGEGLGSVMVAITPAINVSPVDVEFLKPITIQLPTCVAVHGVNENQETQVPQKESDNHDIRVENIVIKIRNKNTKDTWTEADTEVFRSSDSVIFNTQELGDMAAFYKESSNDKHALSKRLAIYLFKSSDFRKKQFASILVSEELPHVIQRGVEGMPAWLEFCDCCSNVILPEGRNLIFYIESADRSLCQTDANKIDIPWENLWSPETVIRKHIHVNMLKRDTPASIQVFVDEGKRHLQAQFLWKTRYQTIHLPQLMSIEDPQNGEQDKDPSFDIMTEQELLKKVTWKPETPVSKFITNKGLLNYASME